MSVDWAAVRAQFPALAGWTYLNTATFGQLPQCAVEATLRHYQRRDELACYDFLSWFDDADQVRALAARLINAAPADIAFIPNASSALSILLNGIDWKPGDRIVTLENEFPNNLYAPTLTRNRGVECIEATWDTFYESINARTRLVAVSTVNYTNGFRLPAEEVAAFLRERGVLLYLDGTQSVGALRFDVAKVQPDMLAVHGYKWLLSPNGAGFVYVAPALRRTLPPAVAGWRSDKRWRQVDYLHHGSPEFVESAEKYEGGMLAFPCIYAMGASLRLFLELGPQLIEERVLSLAAQMKDVLESKGGRVVHTGSQTLAARFEGRDASAIARELYDRRILAAARHGNLRVSVHLYNNEEDLENLRRAL
ncbi:MAG: aminotransferase class V-fold PLP-dependent enzyme [Bryobacteraceae bacterium]|nr:aminotransferase class V-fold PLP-dependent enzyme [Bryobacteraceae bacterium]